MEHVYFLRAAMLWGYISNLVILSSLLGNVWAAGGGSSWSYEGASGPDAWDTIDHNCGGQKQSPIDIDKFFLTHDETLSEFTFHNFQNTSGMDSCYIKNNGHTIQVDLPMSNMYVEGGGLGRTYQVVQFHFHWGQTDTVGSEHTINQQHYPMEVHFVSYAVKYGDILTALNYDDGLAVFGFFFDIGSSNHTAMDTICNDIDNVMYKDDAANMSSLFPLDSLLPSSRSHYYRYTGSLTTPGCNQVVTWTLFTEPIKISSSQMQKFRAVFRSTRNEPTALMYGNYRPVQPINDRVIYTSHGHSLTSTFLVPMMVSCLAIFLDLNKY